MTIKRYEGKNQDMHQGLWEHGANLGYGNMEQIWSKAQVKTSLRSLV